jgi:hypothetical protein
LIEVEMNVPLDALNATKVASSLRVPSKFMQEKLKTVDMMKILADMAFQEPSVLTSFFAARGFQTLLNEACEGEISVDLVITVNIVIKSCNL